MALTMDHQRMDISGMKHGGDIEKAYMEALREVETQRQYAAKLRELVVEQHHARQEDRVVWQCREQVLLSELQEAEQVRDRSMYELSLSESALERGGPSPIATGNVQFTGTEIERLTLELRAAQRRRIDLEAEVTAWALSGSKWDKERLALLQEVAEARQLAQQAMQAEMTLGRGAGPLGSMGALAGGAFGALGGHGSGHGGGHDTQHLLEEIDKLKRAEHDADWRAQVAETNAEYAKLQVQELRNDRRRTHTIDNARGLSPHIGSDAPAGSRNMVEGHGQRAALGT
eukprot:gnl/MRDRNA2_/MRDRNA2_107832_c0_seq1.p1 gnl/MRDRNA2_/MRDRNA2_107832_c0~~gnl/MRDRNA2_/MRDRNA2_107832_c0_seq1.p1  ORF type:complete len:303 (+),score=82.69 gnl/MRDRNA2_/MRDRNA2_107832_c0_seq1:51-911(+)